MSGWAVFGIVLAVFVLIGCIPVGVDASYRENGLALRLKIGLFKLQVLPAKEKKKKPKPKAKKPVANKPDAKPEKPKKQGSMPKLTLSDILRWRTSRATRWEICGASSAWRCWCCM